MAIRVFLSAMVEGWNDGREHLRSWEEKEQGSVSAVMFMYVKGRTRFAEATHSILNKNSL